MSIYWSVCPSLRINKLVYLAKVTQYWCKIFVDFKSLALSSIFRLFIQELKGIQETCHAVLSRFSHVQLFAALWTVACQAPLSMGFSRVDYWSGLPCPPPGDLSYPGIEPTSHYVLRPALAGGFFTTSATWEALIPQLYIPINITNGVCKFEECFFATQPKKQGFAYTSDSWSPSAVGLLEHINSIPVRDAWSSAHFESCL